MRACARAGRRYSTGASALAYPAALPWPTAPAIRFAICTCAWTRRSAATQQPSAGLTDCARAHFAPRSRGALGLTLQVTKPRVFDAKFGNCCLSRRRDSARPADHRLAGPPALRRPQTRTPLRQFRASTRR